MKKQPEKKKPGSGASGLELNEVFSDVGQQLQNTDPDKLAMPPVEEQDRTDHAAKPLIHTEPDQQPGIYHDNIYDPADISRHQSGAEGITPTDAPSEDEDDSQTVKGLKDLHQRARQNAEKGEDDNPNDDLLLNSHTYL
ncbi:MAG: hypothetical protein JSS76_08890 [Bacteroidetes bacterium]|nr:hypothetical protein [Bacteroidota bacterium]MBS1684857.1 hypothetical protein [Bacteroidota bacterium]